MHHLPARRIDDAFGRHPLEGHAEMAEGEKNRAKHHGLAETEIAVGDRAAENRRSINQPAIAAIDADRDIVGKQEMLGQIEDEKGAHAVKAEALPHLGEEEDVKALGVAEQLAAGLARHAFRYRHPCLPAEWAHLLPPPSVTEEGAPGPELRDSR